MKRLIAFVLVFMLAFPAAAESIDLSGLSYAELVALRDRIDMAMWQSKEWKQVVVPIGIWVVGEDIPAGHWTVICPDEFTATRISWGESADVNKSWINHKGRFSSGNSVYNPKHEGGFLRLQTKYDFEVVNGDYIVIENAPAIFVPYAGKPDLGFDWGE